MRICLAEDDLALRSSLCFVLRSSGYEVIEASNGREAFDCIVAAAERGAPMDMLITDVRMPDVNGVELLRLLREAEIRLPVMVVSGHGDKDMLIDLLRLGCDNFLSKPFEPDEVLEKVSEVMRKVTLKQDYAERSREELKRANEQLDREAECYRRDLVDLKSEVDQAVRTYQDLLTLSTEGMPLAVELRNRTLRELGGDFAGCCCRDTQCDFLVADVAGHDLSASYQTVLIKSFFDENCRTGDSGEDFLRRLNTALRENGRNERMTTAAFLRIDLAKGRGTLVSAGHPPVVHRPATTPAPFRLEPEGDVLGLHEKLRLETMTFDIEPGDRLFMTTDGVPGASHVDGRTGLRRLLTQAGLEELLETYAHMGLSRQLDFAWSYIVNFCRGKQPDDMLLLGIEVPER